MTSSDHGVSNRILQHDVAVDDTFNACCTGASNDKCKHGSGGVRNRRLQHDLTVDTFNAYSGASDDKYKHGLLKKRRFLKSFSMSLFPQSATPLLVAMLGLFVTLSVIIGSAPMDRTFKTLKPATPLTVVPLRYAGPISFPRRRYEDTAPNLLEIPATTIEHDASPDVGGLAFFSLSNTIFHERRISSDDIHQYEIYRSGMLDSGPNFVDAQYDNYVPQDEPSECRRNSWRSKIFPTCNNIHELTLERIRGSRQEQEFDVKIIR
jgi:hypothetical protein